MKKRIIFILGCGMIFAAACGCLSVTTVGRWFGVCMAGATFLASRTRYGSIFATECDAIIDRLDTWLEELNKKNKKHGARYLKERDMTKPKF